MGLGTSGPINPTQPNPSRPPLPRVGEVEPVRVKDKGRPQQSDDEQVHREGL